MIKISNKEYKLCLFDTNALSSFLQNPKGWTKYFDNEFGISKTVICYSVFTLSELYYRKELFDRYLECFSVWPSAILDGYESILTKEVDNYFSEEKISPIVILPYYLPGDDTPKEKLIKVIEESGFIDRTKYFKENQKDVIQALIDQKINYKENKKNFSIKEIQEFSVLVISSQLLLRDIHQKLRLGLRESVNHNKFPSQITISYIIFYKYYKDQRKAKDSDMFDIIISALLPYVDYFISEANMCENINQIQERHNFLTHLSVYKLRDVLKRVEAIEKQ